MSRLKKLSHSIWECKLCAAQHNLHYVYQNIMCSQRANRLILVISELIYSLVKPPPQVAMALV